MKKIITTAIITLFIFSICLSPAFAGSRGRNFARGVIVGTTAAIIGAAIISEINHHNTVVLGGRHHEYNRHPHRGHPHRGYWRYEKVWMPPIYEKRWNPGHYNPRGHWVNGSYQRVVIRDEFWKKKRVWVSD